MKEIKFSSNNYIKSYQFYAFPLGILAYNDSVYQKWMVGRFIGITLGQVIQYDERAYDDWEIIDQTLYKELTEDTLDELIRYNIDNDQVIHLWGINEKYIPYTHAYGNYDFIHDLLIVGYDEFNNVAIVNYGEKNILSRKIISKENLKKSFTERSQGRGFKILWNEVKVMDTKEILADIKKYLCSDKPYELKYYNKELNSKHDMLVGISAVKEFLNNLEKNFYRKSHLHSICLLNEHKISMMNTLTYLNTINIIDNEIVQEYNSVVRKFEIIKTSYMKILKKNSDKNVKKIILDIQDAINLEVTILNKIFD
ncbi:MAG: hypothetical protein RRY19_09815 [Clostridium sp.]